MMQHSPALNYADPGRRLNLIKILMIVGIAAWCAGFLLPIFLPKISWNNLFYQFLKLCYSHVCHQSEEASFHINGNHVLVCARCSGIYIGALLVGVSIIFIRINLKLSLKPLLFLSAPLIFDAIAVRLNIYSYSKLNAFITGFLFGSIIIIYIFEVVINSFNRLKTDNEQ